MTAAFPYKHIIWDWNGTLLDDAWLCVDVLNGVLIRRNLPSITPAFHASEFDFPVIDYYRTLGFDFSIEPFERLSDEFIAGYNARVRDCGLREDSLTVLEMARAAGISQSVLSALEQKALNEMMTHYGLRDYFDDVVGIDNHHARGKIEEGQRWIAAQEISASDMLLVGDTKHDYEVASALGVDCVCVVSGHYAYDRLAASGIRVIDSLAQLFDVAS